MNEVEKKYQRKLAKAEAKVRILEKMMEEKTFDLYNKNLRSPFFKATVF